MPIAFNTLNLSLNFHFTADTMQDLAPAIALIVRPSDRPMLAVQVSAGTMDDLMDAIEALARQLDDPDRIAAIRVDEVACCAELEVAPRPVDARRLH